MLTLKLRKIGNSVGLVLPKEKLSQYNLGVNDMLFLTDAPGGFRLTPYSPTFEQQIVIAKEIMKERRDALRELAK